MKRFFKKFVSKDDSLTEEEKEKINQIVQDKDSESASELQQLNKIKDQTKAEEISIDVSVEADEDEGEPVDFEGIVRGLNLEGVNKLREVLDKREGELLENYGLNDEKDNKEDNVVHEKDKPAYTGEIEVKEKVTEKDLDDKTYDVSDDVSNEVKLDKKEEVSLKYQRVTDDSEKKEVEDKVEEVIEVKEVQEDKDLKEDEKNQKESQVVKDKTKKDVDDELGIASVNVNEEETFYSKVQKVFGQENVFKMAEINSSYEPLKGKNVFFIGVRNLKAFEEYHSDTNQNLWFITNMKKINELPKFKILDSTKTTKKLIWEKDDCTILISYKSSRELKGKEDFEFP